jgi:hypothetical protein
MTFIHCLDAELNLLLNSIVQAKKILFQDPLQLASELIGRLRQIKGNTTAPFVTCSLPFPSYI